MSQLINLPQYKISQWQSLWVLLTFSNENSTTFDSTSYPLFYTEGKRYSFWYLMSKWIVLFGESLLEIAFHFLSNLQNSYDFTLNTHALRIKVVLVLSLFDSSPVICFGFFKTLFVHGFSKTLRRTYLIYTIYIPGQTPFVRILGETKTS